MGTTYFLLSPASTGGRRARLLLSERARFALAVRMRSGEGAPIGEVFAFLSGLYFRGKLAYAQRFAASSEHVRVITSDRGLLSPERYITRDDLRAMAAVPIDSDNPVYAEPLARDAGRLGERLGPDATVVLLGSIATPKYSRVLGDVFGERLVFPGTFVGRGDMSRGGLLLRAARSGQPLDYLPVAGAVIRGKRPPKLPRQAQGTGNGQQASDRDKT